MQFLRRFLPTTGFFLVFAVSVSLFGQGTAQTTEPRATVESTQLFQYPPGQQFPGFQPPAQQQPMQQQPIRMQTLQTPPKTVLHNGVTVYQHDPNAATSNRTMPPGYGSPYPTGLQANPEPNQGLRVATTQTDPNRRTGSVYGLPPLNNAPAPPAQPAVGQAPIASAHTAVPGTGVPGNGGDIRGAQRAFVGRAEPPFRIVPFVLDAREQQELDEFLARWERYSDTIKRYEVDFTAYIYDPTVPRDDQSKPNKVTFGYFKFIKPNQFVYHLEGEWKNGAQVKRNEKEEATLGIEEEKIIINEKAFFHYDYLSKTVRQINIPPDKIGLGIADSPLPLIFGAKAGDMKKRFFMKLVTREDKKDTEIWLQTRPRLIEDQQEFRQVEIRLDKKTMRATAIKKDDINGKAHTVYVLSNPKINPNDFVDNIIKLFTPSVPRGWKHQVEDMPEVIVADPAPPAHPGIPATGIAGPAPGNEIPLYTPRQ